MWRGSAANSACSGLRPIVAAPYERGAGRQPQYHRGVLGIGVDDRDRAEAEWRGLFLLGKGRGSVRRFGREAERRDYFCQRLFVGLVNDTQRVDVTRVDADQP